MQYLAQLFKNYEKFLDIPTEKEHWEINEVFDQDFINSVDKTTDFYSDLLITRTWQVFIENKISPRTVEQVQMHKQFDSIITDLQAQSYFRIKPDYIIEEPYEEKEQFEFLFNPDRYFNSVSDFKDLYIDSSDINGFPINK